MEKQTKKLQLSKETIAVLNDEKLSQVYGGMQKTYEPNCTITLTPSDCKVCTTDPTDPSYNGTCKVCDSMVICV